MKRLLTIAAALFALGAGPAGAVTLVNPGGTPVGGVWQQWANEAKVPTLAGSLTFIHEPAAVTAFCFQPVAGCSEGPPMHGPVAASAANNRYALLWELGHQFDWRYLTDADRANLEGIWGTWPAPWWDSPLSVGQQEDGQEASFAMFYQLCADGGGVGDPMTQRTCRLINQIGVRDGAQMPMPTPSAVHLQRRSRHRAIRLAGS